MKEKLCNWKSITLLSLITIVLFVWSPRTTRSDASVSPGTAAPGNCTVSPIVIPKLPDTIPDFTELDPDTQMHVTGTAQVIELEHYSLEITGLIAEPLSLKYDDLRCFPKIQDRPTLVCPGFFEDTATWAGASLKHLLELAGVQKGATHIRMVSADGYAALVTIEEALSGRNFLAYELENEPIPVLHGFPIRAIFPNQNGNKWVKWLVGIEVQ